MTSTNNTPNTLNIEYYRKRAAGAVGLIITEGTIVNHIAASGYDNVPAFFREDALAGWKKVVDAVHEEGGKIAPQLWHVGAISRVRCHRDPWCSRLFDRPIFLGRDEYSKRRIRREFGEPLAFCDRTHYSSSSRG